MINDRIFAPVTYDACIVEIILWISAEIWKRCNDGAGRDLSFELIVDSLAECWDTTRDLSSELIVDSLAECWDTTRDLSSELIVDSLAECWDTTRDLSSELIVDSLAECWDTTSCVHTLLNAMRTLLWSSPLCQSSTIPFRILPLISWPVFTSITRIVALKVTVYLLHDWHTKTWANWLQAGID